MTKELLESKWNMNLKPIYSYNLDKCIYKNNNELIEYHIPNELEIDICGNKDILLKEFKDVHINKEYGLDYYIVICFKK